MKKKQSPPAPRTRRRPAASAATIRSAPVAGTGAPGLAARLAGVVGVGASAGGLEALTTFLRAMPADSGLAFIIVTHQHPGHASLLPDLLRKHTAMPVAEVTNGAQLEPNQVYFSRPDFCVGVERTVVRLSPLVAKAGLRLPIDHLFRALAEELKDRAIGVVLSGTGTDGTLGLRAIKGAGGLALAQSPESAKFAGMPQSAVATGIVDYVVAADRMARPLLNHVRGAAQVSGSSGDAPEPGLHEPMQKIFALLRHRTGHDFSNYKPNTIRRRLERRMNLQQIERVGQYVLFLQEHPHEIDLLGKELLIGVTGFFRDPDGFEALKREGLLPALRELHENGPLRVWVPGCSSGEEAYSLAILFQECAAELSQFLNLQIFATDLDHEAINVARSGFYPDGIAADVGPERLKRCFVREENGYRIRKDIREGIVFAPQNVIKDPPFTKLDLVSCRNLLIYLNPDLQRRLLGLFAYALKPDGLLFLGPSESITGLADCFEVVDRRWKVYRRKPAANSAGPIGDFSAFAGLAEPREAAGALAQRVGPVPLAPVTGVLERALLQLHVPPSVVTNDRGEIVFIHGRTGDYLEPVAGQPRLNVIEMARDGLRLELAAALRRALGRDGKVITKNLRVRTNAGPRPVRVVVTRLVEPESVRGLLLVTFEDPSPKTPANTPAPRSTRASGASRRRLQELENELHFTKESLQSTVEELEASNEELKSTNEELQSTNEELQSTNEELETSKEEMQSLNEELQTVNAQLQGKVEEWSQASDDMQNLLNSTEIATIFLDAELRIKRFTSEARHLIKLIPSDVGRPIGDLVTNLEYRDLQADAAAVMRTLESREREVRTTSGDWRLVRIVPYRTVDNVIDGLVVMFVDINKVKRAEQAAALASRMSASIIATIRESLLVLDAGFAVVSANPEFYRNFQLQPEEVEGGMLFAIADGLWDVPDLRRALGELATRDTVIRDFRLRHEFRRLGPRSIVINARRLEQPAGEPGRFLLVMEDVTTWENRHENDR